MTNTKHTPGAWHISYAHKMGNGYYAAGAAHKILPDKYDGKKDLPIASIFAESKNAKANAHLIEAAPDLLEALAEILEDAEGILYHTPHLSSDYFEKARLAIAKAGGK